MFKTREALESKVRIKTPGEIDAIAAAGEAVAHTLARMKANAVVGTTLDQLEEIALDELARHGAKPSLKGYQPSFSKVPYLFASCLSINEEVIHGMPRPRALREGDVLGMDLVGNIDGWHADSTITVLIGEGKPAARKLLTCTREAMWIGIRASVVGATLGDVGHAIQSFLDKNRLGIVRELAGHGVGTAVHEPGLEVLNFGRRGAGVRLQPGMTFAIEPMVTTGSGKIRQERGDPWTIFTADRSLGAHFEHTIAVTEDGPRVLTALPKQ